MPGEVAHDHDGVAVVGEPTVEEVAGGDVVAGLELRVGVAVGQHAVVGMCGEPGRRDPGRGLHLPYLAQRKAVDAKEPGIVSEARCERRELGGDGLLAAGVAAVVLQQQVLPEHQHVARVLLEMRADHGAGRHDVARQGAVQRFDDLLLTTGGVPRISSGDQDLTHRNGSGVLELLEKGQGGTSDGELWVELECLRESGGGVHPVPLEEVEALDVGVGRVGRFRRELEPVLVDVGHRPAGWFSRRRRIWEAPQSSPTAPESRSPAGRRAARPPSSRRLFP